MNVRPRSPRWCEAAVLVTRFHHGQCGNGARFGIDAEERVFTGAWTPKPDTRREIQLCGVHHNSLIRRGHVAILGRDRTPYGNAVHQFYPAQEPTEPAATPDPSAP